MLNPLEQLCAIEETAVREKATESIKKILDKVKIKDLEKEVLAMILRFM